MTSSPANRLERRLVGIFSLLIAILSVAVALLVNWIFHEVAEEEPIEVLVALGASGAGVLVFAAYVMARRALKPIRALSAQLSEITTATLDRPLEINGRIPEFRTLAENLNAMLARLRQGFEIQRRFVSDTSHEISSPLTIMKGNLEVALRSNRPPEEYREILTDNLEEVERLIRLSNDLLTLANLDAGKLGFTPTEIDLGETVGGILKFVAPAAAAKKIRLESFGESCRVRLDRDRLTQVLLNLLTNAIFYTPPEGTVEVTLRPEDSAVRVTVKDTGPGIPEDSLSNIFLPFYRVSKSRSRQTGGTGLGLAIAKELVEAQGGRIEVTSRIGQGSAFTVVLPRTKP